MMGKCMIESTNMQTMHDRAKDKNDKLIVVSDGSVKNKDMRGTYAWALLKTIQNKLQWAHIEGWGMDSVNTKTGKKRQYETYTKELHSYRMEAMGLLSGLIFLRYTLRWKGTVEWHMDSQSVIDTYNNHITPDNTIRWLKQKDRDIWDAINQERKWWNNRITLIHVESHVDT